MRMQWGGTISAALLVALTRPVAWAVGLAGFLARGGILVLALPIVVLPTLTGLQNALGGPVSTLVFGAPSPSLVAMIAAGSVTAILLLLVGTWVGAWAERQGIAIALEAAADEGVLVPAPVLIGAPGPWRISVIRLLALAPVALAVLFAWRPIYDATYRELILPDDLVTPLVIRVVGDVPWQIIGIGVAWLVGDAAAAVAVRRLVLERPPVLVAWLLGWVDVARRPHRIMPTALVGVGVLGICAAPGLVAAAVGWGRVEDVMLRAQDPVAMVLTIVLWVAIWLAGLLLVGAAAAIRGATWTFELPRGG